MEDSRRSRLRLYVSTNPAKVRFQVRSTSTFLKLLELVGDAYVWSFHRNLLCPVYLLAVGFK